MSLQENMTVTSSAPVQIGKLALALSKAQAVIQNAAKSANNPAYKRDGKESKYADLASVWDACRAALTANELAVIQQVSGGPETVTVTTVLVHSSGESISCAMTGKPTKPDVQGIGSTVTYLRRYSLAAMVGVAPEEDDGNSASGIKEPTQAGTKDTVKKELDRVKEAPKTGGIWLAFTGETGETHGTVTAFLDALEGHLSNSDDPEGLFTINEPMLQKIQAKASKEKNDAIVGRISAIYSHIHAGTVPGVSG